MRFGYCSHISVWQTYATVCSRQSIQTAYESRVWILRNVYSSEVRSLGVRDHPLIHTIHANIRHTKWADFAFPPAISKFISYQTSLSPYCPDGFGWTMHPATGSRIPNSIDNRVGEGHETASELDFLLVFQVAATTDRKSVV